MSSERIRGFLPKGVTPLPTEEEKQVTRMEPRGKLVSVIFSCHPSGLWGSGTDLGRVLLWNIKVGNPQPARQLRMMAHMPLHKFRAKIEVRETSEVTYVSAIMIFRNHAEASEVECL